MNADRVVHAVDNKGGVELVRYERAGKWWLECEHWFPKTRIPIASVAKAAEWAVSTGATVHDRLGGKRFLSEYRKQGGAA